MAKAKPVQSAVSAPNWANRTIFEGDNLDVLRGMNAASVDLVYLDPPFNSHRTYRAPIGSVATGATFKDTWTLSDLDVAWLGLIADREPALYRVIEAAGFSHGKGMKSYLVMMAVRLLELKRILKPTGSIYLHCDPTASHYLKLVADSIFEKDNFQNEIVWCYTRMSARGQRMLSRAHDSILWYSRGEEWVFNVDAIRLPYALSSKAREGKTLNRLGSGVSREGKTVLNPLGKFPEDWIVHIPYLRGKERTGYPTQKPLALLERIVKASSNEGDVVLDPFCGCATTCIAAEMLGRQWVGIDLSPLAGKIVVERLQKVSDEDGLLKGGKLPNVIHRTDLPRRTDIEELPDYRTHKHVLYGEQEGNCKGCGVHFPFQNMTVDHLTPRSKGGADNRENLQLLCNSCNSRKGSGTQAELIVRLREAGILYRTVEGKR